jgi:solute carrier family 25 carnitine/acylcarnitine transporter 20/29
MSGQPDACSTSLSATKAARTSYLSALGAPEDSLNKIFAQRISQLAFSINATTESLAFLPDFTEHPKPKKKKVIVVPSPSESMAEGAEDPDEVTFFHDFVAGGVAGSASVIVGHPFDTMKVRMQTAAVGSTSQGLLGMVREFGGLSSLYRGLEAPLSAAAVVNAVIFSSYGVSSRLWDDYMVTASDEDDSATMTHDPWQKSMTCGSFSGLVQCVIVCPMEHIKCRLQVQHGRGASDYQYKGPLQAMRKIAREHGWLKLYQGWWSTCGREVPAFGLYFASYDYLKDIVHTYFDQQFRQSNGGDMIQPFIPTHAQTIAASALAGGCAGCWTWLIVYPVDIIKTRIQTSPLNAPSHDLGFWRVGSSLVAKYGWKYLFRGLSVTMIRAFPVNATIFPVYEYTLVSVCEWENSRK